MTETRRSGAQEPSNAVDHLHAAGPGAAGVDRDRHALGAAFLKRINDVADLQIALVGNNSQTRPTSLTASQSFGTWLMTGKADLPSIGEFTRVGATGLIQDQTSLREITKLTLAWRDAVMFVLREEAELLTLHGGVLKSVLAVVQESSDAFAVQFAAQYDIERQELQLQLAESKAQLVHRATHDSLTGLDNRASFFDRLDEVRGPELSRSDAVAVLFVDLDRFKVVNDQFGHAVGDVVLQTVADRLRSVVRPGDTLSRLGGDEFVILCGGIKEAEAPGIATRVALRIKDAFAVPIVVGGSALAMTASIGIAVDRSGRGNAEELVAAADAAMYVAKERRSNECEIELAR
jgi:diguanylate cyclase (GGDEF)-like protein